MPSIQELLKQHAEEPRKLVDALCVDTIETREQEAYLDEYKGGRTRRLKSVQVARKSKTIDVTNEKGKKTGEKTIHPAQLIYDFPKKIVRTATHFLFGGKMSVSAEDQHDGFNEFARVWDKVLKMQTALKRMARICMIETKSAIVFYPQPIKDEEDPTHNKELKLRSLVLSSENGEFFPHFDDFGDMDAFIRKYAAKNLEGKDITKAVIYTEKMTHTLIHDGEWQHVKGEENKFGKIPVVYVEQKLPEWEGVVSLIDAFEVRLSRLADTNDYFAEPLLKLFGEVLKAPGKDEVGKMIRFKMVKDMDGKPSHGDAEYATWDHTPESVKLELDETKEGIYSMSSTPDLSFNNVKGMNFKSGKAMLFMFMDALMKKEENGEVFYDALNRCISVVVAGIVGYTKTTLKGNLNSDDIQVEFTDQLPDDMEDFINSLVSATGGKPILSQETAAGLNPLVSDANQEVERLKGESTVNETFEM